MANKCWICKEKLSKREKTEGDVCDHCWNYHLKTGTPLKVMEKQNG